MEKNCFSFAQDFGDYATAYYSVQTHEGQQISQLIAGYIDIILKKVRYRFASSSKSCTECFQRKDRECTTSRDGIGDEESTMIEDIIAPGK